MVKRFFAESLRENTSFEAAFKDASLRVSEREKFMGFEPSEPQMVIGSLMQTALPAFEQVLFDKSRPSVSSISANNGAIDDKSFAISPAIASGATRP